MWFPTSLLPNRALLGGAALAYGAPVRVLFLSEAFPAARMLLREVLPTDDIEACPIEMALARLPGADVLVPTMARVDAALMDAARPKLIQQFGAGVDGVDLAAAAARHIPVANVPAGGTGNAVGVAEMAVLHLLTICRRIDAAREALAGGRLGEPLGRSLLGQTATVLGLGNIGGELVRRLSPFGLRLIGVGRAPASRLDPGLASQLDAYHPVGELDQALARSDVLVLCLPLTDSTRGIIGARELALLRPGAVLINVARGPLVERAALLDALHSGRLSGAGLDVFWEEPPDPADPVFREAVVATPHVGAVTDISYRATARAFADNIERLRRGAPLHNLVI